MNSFEEGVPSVTIGHHNDKKTGSESTLVGADLAIIGSASTQPHLVEAKSRGRPENMLLGIKRSPSKRNSSPSPIRSRRSASSTPSTRTSALADEETLLASKLKKSKEDLDIPKCTISSHDADDEELLAAGKKARSATFSSPYPYPYHHTTLPYHGSPRSPYLNVNHAMSEIVLPQSISTTSTFPRANRSHLLDDEAAVSMLNTSTLPPDTALNSPNASGTPSPYSLHPQGSTTSINSTNACTPNGGHPVVMLPYASKRRDQEFHELFAAIPPEEVLIEDFTCAWQKEILIQGRLYVSEKHLCFHANILGWAHDLVLRLTDIGNIDKKNIALLIPNSLEFVTQGGRKYFFASFLYRDSAYDLIQRVWYIAQENPVISFKLHTFQRFCPLHEENHDDADDCTECKRIREAGYLTDNSSISDYGTLDRRKQQQTNDAMLQIPTVSGQAATVPRTTTQSQCRPGSPFATIPHRRRHSMDSIESPISVTIPEYSRAGDSSSNVSPAGADDGTTVEKGGGKNDAYDDIDKGQTAKVSDSQHNGKSVIGISDTPTLNHGKISTQHYHNNHLHPHPHHKTSKAPLGVKRERRFAGIAVCPDEALHQSYTKAVDVIIPAHISRVWNLLFGGADGFMRQYLEDTRKITNVSLGTWTPPGEDGGNGHVSDDGVPLHSFVAEGWSRKVDYTMPLNFGMFPVVKATRCNIVEKVMHWELDRYVCIEAITNTPDVPAGNCFQNHVRTCLTVNGPDHTRLRSSVQVEFLKSTILRSTIEKATVEGAVVHSTELSNNLIHYIQGHPDLSADGDDERENDATLQASMQSGTAEIDQLSLSEVGSKSSSKKSIRGILSKTPTLASNIVASPVTATTATNLAPSSSIISTISSIILAPFTNLTISNESIISLAIFAIIMLLIINTYVMFKLSAALMRFEGAIVSLSKI